jgi:hypothetical protein
MAKYLLQFGIIGCGTIDDLKRSPHYGKEKLFIWTNDKVITSNYQVPIKEPKIGTYKTERLLTTDDFTSRGISTKEIGSFYQSELGKSVKGKTKEEALELLEQWIKKTHKISESAGQDLSDTFEDDSDIYRGGSAEFEEINLEDVSGLDVWPNNFISIEFWK